MSSEEMFFWRSQVMIIRSRICWRCRSSVMPSACKVWMKRHAVAAVARADFRLNLLIHFLVDLLVDDGLPFGLAEGDLEIMQDQLPLQQLFQAVIPGVG